jgi:hypothetical protein
MKKIYLVFLVLFMGLCAEINAQGLIITEIMYNDPSGGTNGDSLEYVEIYNGSSESVNIANYQFATGIKIIFPIMTIPAWGYLIVAKNANAVQNFFNITGVLQWDAGETLSNTGEALVLKDASTLTLDSVSYLPTTPWPTAGNGLGSSIMLCDPFAPNQNGANWAAAMPSNASIYNILAGYPVFATPGAGCIVTPPYQPVLASFPMHEAFNLAWINGDHYHDVPKNTWRNTPASGNTSWRREDEGPTAAWTNATTGMYTPIAAQNTIHSARFHTAGSTAGTSGTLDLYVYLGMTGFKKLSFWYMNSAGTDSLAVYASSDNGVTFTFLQKYLITNGWEKKQISLGNIVGNYGVIRFKATSNAGTSDIGIDEVDVAMTPQDDAGVAEIVSPNSFLSNLTDTVKVTLSNYGSNDLNNVTINWSVNGVLQSPVVYNTLLVPTQISAPVVLGPFTFSASGVSTIKAWTSLPNGNTDSDPTNDSTTKPAYYQTYTPIPYLQTFESQWVDKQSIHDVPDEFWVNNPASSNNSWRRQDDGATAAWTGVTTGLYTPAGANISAFSARFHSGGATAGTQGMLNLYANFNTPGSKRLTFWHINTTGSDSLAVWISTDNGANFTFLQKFTTSGTTWVKRKIDIGEIMSPTVVIRFRATGTGGTNPTDIGIDDVEIGMIPNDDAGILSFVSPGLILSGITDTVKVILKNFGGNLLSSAQVNWSVNGVAQTSYSWNGALPSLGASGVINLGAFTFPNGLISTIKVWTSSPNGNTDSDPVNDTLNRSTYYQTYATLPVIEHFDNAWINKQAVRDVPSFFWTNSPVTGSNSWRRNDDGASANWTNGNVGPYTPGGANGTPTSARFHTGGSTGGQIGYLYLYVNMNMAGDKELRYWHINTAGQDSLAISMSTDGGASYTFVEKVTVDAAWTQHVVQLGNINSPTTILRFRVTSNNNGNTDVGLDEVSVAPVLPDAGVSKILTPVSSCNIPANTDMNVRVKNYGSLPLTNIPVHSPAGVYTITNTLQPGDSADIFVGTTTIATGTTANLVFFTTMPGDIFPQNDTLKAKVTSYSPINTFPFVEDFESGATEYFALQGASNAQVSINPTIGNNSTVGLLMTGRVAGTWPGSMGQSTTPAQAFGYADHAGKAYSACIVDATTLNNPELKIDLRMGNSSGWAYSYFRVMVNDTVQLVDNAGLQNFNSASNNNDPFVTHTFDLSSYANTQFKLTFQSACKYDNANGQGGLGDNVFLDNIRIKEKVANDAGIISISSPVSNCGLTNAEAVSVLIRNFGYDTLTSLEIFYSINGGPTVTQTISLNLLPGDDTLFTFTSLANLSIAGVYTISVTIGQDEDPSNNNMLITVVNTPYINAYSYFEDFENGMGGWSSGLISGANDWQWGTPAQTALSTAHSGTKAWMTGLTANYHDNANCYILSPCFDFTSLVNPMLSVWLNLKTELNYDAMILEASDNGGAWTKVTGGNGFYNNTSTQGNLTPPKWSGNNNGWTQYMTTITSFAGSPKVQFRFRFVADYVQNDEGVAIDDFNISEKAADLVLRNIVSPANGCGLITPSPVTIEVSNFGFMRADSLITRLKVDGGSYVYETHHDTLQPGETKVIGLTATANLLSFGEHTVTVGVYNQFDPYHWNDSIIEKYYLTGPISSPPISTDFELPGFFQYFGLENELNSNVSLENTIGNPGHALLMTGGAAGTWMPGTGNSTTYEEAFAYSDHLANIYTCDVTIPQGGYWGLHFDLKQTYSEGPKTSWLRVLVNDVNVVPEMFTGDTALNPVTANSDAFVYHPYMLTGNPSPMRVTIQSANRLDAAHSTTGVGDVAIVDNLGISVFGSMPETQGLAVITYPNPATDELHVSLSKTIKDGTAEVRNMQGQLMLLSSVNGSREFTIDLKKLPAAVYSIVIKGSDAMNTMKFIKTK